MVSKFLKKTPIKSIKDCRNPRRHRKKSPNKTVSDTSSAVIAAINKSFFTCQRRLVKIFSKLARISTPNRRRKGYKILKTFPEENWTGSVRRSLFLDTPLPPVVFPGKKTVFLDLDETLIHSKSDPPPEKFDFVVKPKIEGESLNFYVLKRPGVEELLEELSKKFEIVVFTAGLREYASLVLDEIDPKGVISHRLYRDSCREMEGKFVKDLSVLGRDLKMVVIVDDNPNAYELQPENAIPIRPFIDDLDDKELGKLVKFFERFDQFDDVRDFVKLYLAEGDKSLDL